MNNKYFNVSVKYNRSVFFFLYLFVMWLDNDLF